MSARNRNAAGIAGRAGNKMGEPKKKPFESKKKFEARRKAEETIKGYLSQDLQRGRKAARPVRKQRCPHCHGRKVMSNGKPCRNCGGDGSIYLPG